MVNVETTNELLETALNNLDCFVYGQEIEEKSAAYAGGETEFDRLTR